MKKTVLVIKGVFPPIDIKHRVGDKCVVTGGPLDGVCLFNHCFIETLPHYMSE